MSVISQLLFIDALGPNGSYRSQNRLAVADVAGHPLAELSLVPRLFVTRAMAALHKAQTLPLEDRLTVLARAGKLFATGEIDGMSAATYQYTVSRMSGTSLPIVRGAMEEIAHRAAEAYRSAQQARPSGAVNDPLAREGTAVWIRRGNVLAVHAPGNNPGVHSTWLEPLALGYRVAIRPSRREPLTPYRLINALRACGFGDDQVALLPTDHDAAGEVLRQADLSMVYGGQEVIERYAGNPAVLPNGPGRSKILVTADSDWHSFLDMIVASNSHEGGTACVNTTAVFVEGDPTPVAEAIAERLAAIPSLPPEDEQAILTAYSLEAARQIERYLLAKAAGIRAHLGGDGVVDELGDGSAVLRPAVHQLDDPFAEQANIELAFPCVWVAPWTREAGITPLKHTLVFTAVTKDEKLLDEQNLQDHPVIVVLYACTQPISLTQAQTPEHLQDFIDNKRGPLTSNIGEAGAFVRTQANLSLPDIQYHFMPGYYLKHGFIVPPGDGYTIAPCLLHPQSRGYIALRSTEPTEAPLIQPNYFAEESDIQALVEGIKIARKLGEARAFAPFRDVETLPGSLVQCDEEIAEYIHEYMETIYHPAGTCKMGNDSMAVVDAHLRVRGVEGLRVIDASIMPTLVGGNTNAPTIMIAEKAADLIKGTVSVLPVKRGERGLLSRIGLIWLLLMLHWDGRLCLLAQRLRVSLCSWGCWSALKLRVGLQVKGDGMRPGK